MKSIKILLFLSLTFSLNLFSQNIGENDSIKLKLFYEKHNIKTIKDFENYEKLQELINVWDDCQILLLSEPNLNSIFKPTVDELEFNINGLAPNDFSLSKRKEEIQKKISAKNDYLSQSYILEKEGKYQVAIDLLLKKEELNDDDYAQIGKCYFYLKNYKNAIENYSKAIDINPNKSVYYNNMALVLKYYNTIGSIDSQLHNINKAISLEPNNASYYITRANIETDMKGLKWNEENMMTIRKISLTAYKSDFNDFSKAIELEPNNLEFRKNRISLYKKLWNEDVYNNDPNMIFDIREFIIEDYIKIIEITKDDIQTLPQRQKLADLYYDLRYKNSPTDYNGKKLYNLNYANFSLSEFKKIYSIDKNENYNNDYIISDLFQNTNQHNEAIQYFSNNIRQENNENKKNNLILSLGKYYIWLSENNIDKNANQSKAFIEFDNIFTKLDNKIKNTPNSLELLAERIKYTRDIAQLKYFEKSSNYLDKIIKIYDTDNSKCQTLSFAFYSMIKQDKSKNMNCFNEAKKLIEIMAEGERAEQVVTMLTGKKKEDFIEYYKKNRNLK